MDLELNASLVSWVLVLIFSVFSAALLFIPSSISYSPGEAVSQSCYQSNILVIFLAVFVAVLLIILFFKSSNKKAIKRKK